MGAKPNEMLLHYRLVEEIGKGGMGVVYRAYDTKLQRPAAVKVLKPELLHHEEHRQRFLREALSAASVTHPYIAAIYEAGDADGTLFIAMEYVEGRTLRVLLGKGPFPIAETQRYAIEIAEGLAKAHQAGLVHRDLKPDNVIIANDGHVRILDFGLAKVVEKRDEMTTITFAGGKGADVTTRGAILGTPAYMSPEQARGEPVDFRSDVFAFGSTVHEMLTGEPPFRRSTPADTLASILRDDPPAIDTSNPAVPEELNRIVRRCLHKRPEDRFNDTRDLAAALRDLQTVPAVFSPRQTVPAPARKPWGRYVALLAASLTVVVLLVVQPWEKTPKPGPDMSPVSEKPNWILVAEFEAPPDNPGLGPAARVLLEASLEQSSVVTPIPRDQLRRGLALAMKPDTTRVLGEVGGIL